MKNSIKKNKHLLNSRQSLLSKFSLNLNIATFIYQCEKRKKTNEQINAKLTFMLEFYARNKGSSI